MTDTQPRLAFLHIAKTGGTSVSDVIEAKFKTGDQFVSDSPEKFREKVLKFDPDLNRSLIRGHFNVTDAADLFAGQKRILFTIVRDPISQLMSLLWHFACYKEGTVQGRDHPPYSAAVLDRHLDEAIAHYGPADLVSQYQYFLTPGQLTAALESDNTTSAKQIVSQALEKFTVVGVSEQSDLAIGALFKKMGWGLPNVTKRARASGAGRAKLPDRALRAFKRRLDIDGALYAKAGEIAGRQRIEN